MSSALILEAAISSGNLDELAILLAHEFRVPVHALEAYLSVLKQGNAGPLNDVQSDLVTSMFTVVRRLERLTHDVEVMAATDGSFPIVFEEVDLMHVVSSCMWELQPIGSGYGVDLQVHATMSTDFHITADPIRLEQVILNILENAIRYSPSGSCVAVHLRTTPYKVSITFENESSVPVDVLQEGAFQAFVRGPSSFEHHPVGSGIGLSVVEQLVQAHQGRVVVRTRDNMVRIMVMLPRRPRTSAPHA